MSLYNDLTAERDTLVDEMLGDTVLYSVAGRGWRALDAFILEHEVESFVDGIDPVSHRYRLKIAKAHIANPTKADRVKCTDRLGDGAWQVGPGKPSSQGRYWLLDLRRA